MKKNKFNTILKAKEDESEHQAELKESYHINQPDVVVVEKAHWLKFFVQTLLLTVRVVLYASLILMAVIGVYSLINPQIRMILQDTFNIMLQELNTML